MRGPGAPNIGRNLGGGGGWGAMGDPAGQRSQPAACDESTFGKNMFILPLIHYLEGQPVNTSQEIY